MVTQASLFGFYFGVSAVHSAYKQKLLCLKALPVYWFLPGFVMKKLKNNL